MWEDSLISTNIIVRRDEGVLLCPGKFGAKACEAYKNNERPTRKILGKNEYTLVSEMLSPKAETHMFPTVNRLNIV